VLKPGRRHPAYIPLGTAAKVPEPHAIDARNDVRLRCSGAADYVQVTLDGAALLPVAVKPTVAVAPAASVPS